MAGKTEQNATPVTDVAALAAQLETVTKERDAIEAELKKLEQALIDRGAINPQSDDNRPVVEVALFEMDKVIEMTAERDALKRSLSAQKGSTTKAKATVEDLKAAAKPRPIGYIDRDTDMTPAYLFELVAAADLVEIVFSDGKQEVAGLGPVVVEGDAWKMTNTGLKLHVPTLQVHGPAAGKPPYRVTGYALLLDGEQVCWSQRHEQLTIGAGQTFNLADDIVF